MNAFRDSSDSDWFYTPPTVPTRRRRVPSRGVVTTSLVALIAGLVGGVVGARLENGTIGGSSSPLVTAPPVDTASVGTSSVAKAANVISPSVVTIDSVNSTGESIGTGVIISSDGQIVTNHHVIEGSTTVRVRLAGETDARIADVLASDAGNDLGLIKLRNVSGLTAATFADPTSLAVGDEVVAIGYALDLDGAPSVTSGVISALNRTMITDSGALNALIQTDTPISSGNSGGPLINMSGQVVGINTAVARGDSSTAANNIGFAISVGEVTRVIKELRLQADGEKRAEGYLGIGLTDRSDAGQGAVIAEVADNSPASKAGLKVDDVVLEINNQPVTGQGTVIAVVRDSSPGDTVTMTIKRDGRTLTLTATLVARPSN